MHGYAKKIVYRLLNCMHHMSSRGGPWHRISLYCMRCFAAAVGCARSTTIKITVCQAVSTDRFHKNMFKFLTTRTHFSSQWSKYYTYKKRYTLMNIHTICNQKNGHIECTYSYAILVKTSTHTMWGHTIMEIRLKKWKKRIRIIARISRSCNHTALTNVFFPHAYVFWHTHTNTSDIISVGWPKSPE